MDSPSRNNILAPQVSNAVFFKPNSEILFFEALKSGSAVLAIDHNNIFNAKMVDKCGRLGGNDHLRSLGCTVNKFGKQCNAFGVQPQLRLVNDDGFRQFGLQQGCGKANECSTG